MRTTARLLLVALGTGLVAALFACSDRVGQPTGADDAENADTCERFPNLCTPGPNDAPLVRVGRALDAAGSYRIVAAQENLVLARWGGSDGGTVAVDLKDGSAVADLRRTGDGQYAVVLRNGETYFKRGTCPSWAKIQEGGGVLAPFVLTSGELNNAKVIEVRPAGSPSSTIVTFELDGLGPVSMEVDNSTSRPLHLSSDTATNNGKRLEWTFDRWGEKVDVPSISADRLSGPGGNPC